VQQRLSVCRPLTQSSVTLNFSRQKSAPDVQPVVKNSLTIRERTLARVHRGQWHSPLGHKGRLWMGSPNGPWKKVG